MLLSKPGMLYSHFVHLRLPSVSHSVRQSVCLSVCLSIRLSHSWTESKRLNLSSNVISSPPGSPVIPVFSYQTSHQNFPVRLIVWYTVSSVIYPLNTFVLGSIWAPFLTSIVATGTPSSWAVRCSDVRPFFAIQLTSAPLSSSSAAMSSWPSCDARCSAVKPFCSSSSSSSSLSSSSS